LDGEIAAIVGDHTTGEHLATLLTDEAVEKLPGDQQDAADLVEANQKQLHEGLEEQGAIRQQQQQLADDRRLAERQLELSVVEQRLAEALETWQVRTVTWLLLESIRKEYEQNRQPETLTEASGYLRRLTDDHNVRVWTPLGEDVLYVEDAQGESLSVDVLSRGTREQLFLSLRLALVALVARRGTQLPLVLDDVLVNFDADRAKAAARVLRDFAKAGHQLLVFTCHEHVWKMFKAMKVDVRRLPDRTVAIAAETTDDRAPKPEVAPAAKSGVEVVAEEILEEELSPVAADDAPDEADECEEEADDENEEEDEYEEEDEEEYEEDDEEYEEDEYEEEDDEAEAA
ncbi:MAG: hypothetical protein V3V75_11350, partial [Thermoguttaceae bacterium]